MRLALVLFALVLAMCLVVGIALLTPETPDGHGIAHAEHPGMLRSPPGDDRHSGVMWLGWGLGVLQIAFFGLLFAFGARKGRDLRGLGLPLLGGTLLYAVVWTLIFATHRAYVTDPGPQLFLGLPLPTALFLYVLYPLPLVFVGLFAVGYRRWILTDRDLREYQELLESRRPGGDPEAGP